jgi:hypothetical protein
MQKIIERWSRIHFNIQAYFENWRFAFSIHHQAGTKGDTYDNFAILVMSDEAGRRTDNVALWIILRSIRSRPDPD